MYIRDHEDIEIMKRAIKIGALPEDGYRLLYAII